MRKVNHRSRRVWLLGLLVAALAATGVVVTQAEAIEGGTVGTGNVRGVIPATNGVAPNSDLWVVGLFVGEKHCTASVIADYWLLTARHCVEAAVARSGDELPDDSDFYYAYRYYDGNPVEARLARAYFPDNVDLALVTLREPFLITDPSGERRRPISPGLPTGPTTDFRAGVVAYGTGRTCADCLWVTDPKASGASIERRTTDDDRYRSELLWFYPAEVKITWKSTGGSVTYPKGYIHDGDSGGPLVAPTGAIIGVISKCSGWDAGCGATYLWHYKSWILETMGF